MRTYELKRRGWKVLARLGVQPRRPIVYTDAAGQKWDVRPCEDFSGRGGGQIAVTLHDSGSTGEHLREWSPVVILPEYANLRSVNLVEDANALRELRARVLADGSPESQARAARLFSEAGLTDRSPSRPNNAHNASARRTVLATTAVSQGLFSTSVVYDLSHGYSLAAGATAVVQLGTAAGSALFLRRLRATRARVAVSAAASPGRSVAEFSHEL